VTVQRFGAADGQQCIAGTQNAAVYAWEGRSLAAGEVRVVLVDVWSPSVMMEVVVGLWDVLEKLQDRLQLCCSCF